MAIPVNIFGVGKTGLMASRRSMGVTSHNIANVNTPGYSRQVVDQTNSPPVGEGKNQVGTGVMVNNVSRVNDKYLETRIQREQTNFGHLEERETYLAQTEQIFNEANSDGLNQIMTRFFNEFRKLSTEPENTAIRSSVREASRQLVVELNRVDKAMKEVQSNMDTRIEGYVHDLNSLAKEVRDLNLLVERSELDGSESADLRDKREALVKKMSGIADVAVGTDKSGKITVTLGGHIALVNGGDVLTLKVERTPANPDTGKRQGALDIIVEDGPVANTVVTDRFNHGRLGGLLEVRDKEIGTAQGQIDEVAYGLATQTNALHATGYGRDGGTGRLFFKDLKSKEGAAELLDLSDDVKNSLDAIATAKDPNAPADNRIAIAISGLSSAKGVAGGDKSMVEMYNAMVSQLGVKTGAAKESLEFQRDIVSQLDNFRERISGVSLDEETANLVQLQHAYAANAKVIQVADETMKTILNML